MSSPLTGRTALITGATGGIGSALCHRIATQGSAIALTHLDDHRAAETLTTDITTHGGTAIAFEA